jgi:hypothetical protein
VPVNARAVARAICFSYREPNSLSFQESERNSNAVAHQEAKSFSHAVAFNDDSHIIPERPTVIPEQQSDDLDSL